MPDKSTAERWRSRVVAAIIFLAVTPTVASAADQIYFPATTNVTTLLVQRINAETVRIDMSAWYLSEHAISIAVANRFKSGVPVRLLGDRGAIFEADPNTRREFYWLASQGVPIRLRYHPNWYPEINHWKAAMFAGQNLVEFGSANYTPVELAPLSSSNYKDETVLFSDDPAIVNAFRTKFDQMWNDTTPEPRSMLVNPPFFKNWDEACALESACADYRVQYPNPVPMVIDTRRLEADNPMPADLIWGQGPLFNNRLITEINREQRQVDLVAYRITVEAVADALIARFRAGVPVRFIVEPEQYLSRLWPEYWLTHAFTDKMWAAGIPVRQRRHGGLTHMKMLVTSSYATNASSNIAANWERDHNYFVPAAAKPTIHTAMKNRFADMWNDPSAFETFVPRPPDAATLVAPSSGASDVTTRPTFVWNTAAFAVSYDVYLGSSSGMALVANVPAQLVPNPPTTYSWIPPTSLQPGRTYSWKVVSRTFATAVNPSIIATSATHVFRTEGGTSGDFDGDAKADIALYRPSSGTWFILHSSTNAMTSTVLQWGQPGDVPLSGDYNGDALADAVVFRPSNGTWYFHYSGATPPRGLQWGTNGDIPVPADFNGDTLTDAAVFRPSNGTWYFHYSGGTPPAGFRWGANGDVPAPADYDGDGRADLAVFRPSDGTWYFSYSSGRPASGLRWGTDGDIPVAGDYNGDGLADAAVFRPSDGIWYFHFSGTTPPSGFHWGQPGDVPVPGDYDGDGRTDMAVFRPSMGVWYVLKSSTNFSTWTTHLWGIAGDLPVIPQ